MSEHAHAPGGHPPAEADRIQSGTIVGVVAATLLLFVVSGGVTVLWLYRQREVLNPAWAAIPPDAGKAKIGLVEQQLFESSNRPEVQRAGQVSRLHGYGWVDREKGIVHIPIEEAMGLVLKGERP